MIRISIVIATYNASRTLKKCLGSIIPQLTEECEIVVVDGGSKDATNEIIESFGDKITIHVSEPDKGIYDAWNKGVKLSRGEWVAFVGADDVLLPGALACYLDVLRNNPKLEKFDYICAYDEYVDEKENFLNIIGGAPEWKIFRRRMNVAHVASLHNKKNLFEAVGGYDISYKICADYELLLRKRDRLKYYFLPKHIAKMQMGGMSFSTRAIKETYDIRKKHRSVDFFENVFLYVRDWLGFKFYCVRQLLKGKMNLPTFFFYMKK